MSEPVKATIIGTVIMGIFLLAGVKMVTGTWWHIARSAKQFIPPEVKEQRTDGNAAKEQKTDGNTVTDADGNVYQTVKIGNQVWTAENLRTTKYNDGSAIPLITDSVAWAHSTAFPSLHTTGYCYYNNTADADSNKKYGALYNWYIVADQKLAPAGWHVPSDAEWDTLRNCLIANGYNWDGSTTGNKIAKSIAAKTDWGVSTIPGEIGNDLTQNDRSGFSALPGGYRGGDGAFYNIGINGYWWSATENTASLAYYRNLGCTNANLSRYRNYKSCGCSVRLLRN